MEQSWSPSVWKHVTGTQGRENIKPDASAGKPVTSGNCKRGETYNQWKAIDNSKKAVCLWMAKKETFALSYVCARSRVFVGINIERQHCWKRSAFSVRNKAKLNKGEFCFPCGLPMCLNYAESGISFNGSLPAVFYSFFSLRIPDRKLVVLL